MEEGREVFRIEHRETREGAFRSCAVEVHWRAFSIPTPLEGCERVIDRFLTRVSTHAIFAYLSTKSILNWFEPSELVELDSYGYHVSVFLVSDSVRAGAFSPTQAVFLRNRVKWVRNISLLDL